MAAEKPFELGDWRVDPARGAIVRDGRETRLEPKQMDLLLLFAGSPSRVITKDEIIARVWDGRAIGDDTLAAAISRLRTALGDSPSRRYIETLPKRGYRLLIAPGGGTGLKQHAEQSEAALLVARGRDALRIPLAPSLAQARAYFEGAIRADPRNAGAHVGFAEALLAQLMMSQGGSGLAADAKRAAQAATAIDEGSAQAWCALGAATLMADRDFAAADAALLRAIAIDAGLPSAHSRRAFALSTVGRLVEAEREARRAVELDPLSFATRNILLQQLLLARRYAHAIAEAKAALKISAQSFEAWLALGWAHFFQGDEREAVQALREGMRLMGTGASSLARIDHALAEGGFEAMGQATADLFELQGVMFVPRALDIAMLRALTGEADRAFAALDRAAALDDPILLVAPWLPHLDRLRNDPRFPALIERIRLVH